MRLWVAGCVVLLLLTVANARSNAGSLQPETAKHQNGRTLSQASATQRVLTEGPHLQRYESFLERNVRFHSKLSDAFKDLDSNHDGRLSQAELQRALERKALTPMDYHLVKGFDVNADGHVSAQEFQYGPMFVSVLELHPELSEEFANKASSGSDSVPDLRSFFQSALQPESQSNLRSLVQQHQSRVRAAKGSTHERTHFHRNAGGLPGEALAFLELEALGAGEIVTVSARVIPAGPATLLEAESSSSRAGSKQHNSREAEPDWSQLDHELDPMNNVEADDVSKFDENALRDVLVNSRISPDITRPSSWKTDKPGYVEPSFVPSESTLHTEQRLEAVRWSGGNTNNKAKQVKMVKDQAGVRAAKQQQQPQQGKGGLRPAIIEPPTPINGEEERFGQVQVQQGQKKFIGNLVKAVGGAVGGIAKMATGALTGTKITDKNPAQVAQEAAKPQSKFGVPAYEDEKCIICQYAMQRVRHNLYARLTNDPNESVGSGTPDAMAMRDVNSQIMNRSGGKGLLRIVYEDTVDNLCSSESMPELFYSHCQEMTKEKKTLLKSLFFQYNADAACEEANLCNKQSYFAKDTAVHLPDMSKKFNSGRGACGMRGGAHERGGAMGGLMCAGAKMFMK